jgi:sortase A
MALRSGPRLLLWLGAVLLIYAAGTAAYAAIYQDYQSRSLERSMALYDTRAVSADGEAARQVPEIVFGDGDMIGRLEIPRIGVSVIVLHGIGGGTLRLGVGHVPGTSLPGAQGNVVIAGHRDTFFRPLEGIRSGDVVRVATVSRIYEYTVDSVETVRPEDTYVMESRARSELTLITCYPFHFMGAAPERFIVHATPSL